MGSLLLRSTSVAGRRGEIEAVDGGLRLLPSHALSKITRRSLVLVRA